MSAQPARTPTPPRRTVTIRGMPDDRQAKIYDFPVPARRPDPRSRRARPRAGTAGSYRSGPRPDRIALWAVLMALFLVLVAATSSHAAVIATALH